MNAPLEPAHLAAIHRHLDEKDQYAARLESMSADDVLEMMPDREIQEVGYVVLKAIGDAQLLEPQAGKALIAKAMKEAEDAFKFWLREAAQ